MIRLGLTGSIGMGKSATAKLFAGLGIAVFDADATVHELYAAGGAAVAPVGAAFPGVVVNGAIDRTLLAEYVLGDREALARLEAIVHPLVRAAEQRFLREAHDAGDDIVLLDIPLLFETQTEHRADRVVVVSAPEEIQRARVLERDGMTVEKLDAILAKQMPDAEKRARADFVVLTDKGRDDALRQVETIVETLRAELADQTSGR